MSEAPVNAGGLEDAQSRLSQLQSTLDITNTLLGAISSADPVRTLIARVGVLCRGTAVVYDFEGNVIASTGDAPTQLIWNEVSATAQQELILEIGRWNVMTRRVALRDGIHVLAIASRGSATLEEIGELLLDTSERLLGAVYGIQHGATLRDQRDNEQLLASLHDGVLPSREHRFWARLSQFRFAAYTELRALEFAPLGTDSADESHVTALLSRARADDIPLLITLRRVEVDAPATVSALVPDTAASGQWADKVSGGMLVGASAPFSALANVPVAVHEADTALNIARTRASVLTSAERIGPVLIDQIDLTTWVLSHVDQRALHEYIDQVLAPLRDTALEDTLITYLAAEQNISLAAEALFVHPNTVRYRLSRLEEILDAPISAAATISNLVLALYPQILGRSAELRTLQSRDSRTRTHV
ncbi:MAG: PucR family transcriptional regulator [Leucobacter sp.]|nr:PucR family transcriptional regulator [Leucobacter sp.]